MGSGVGGQGSGVRVQGSGFRVQGSGGGGRGAEGWEVSAHLCPPSRCFEWLKGLGVKQLCVPVALTWLAT
jgi:hypothetical protein